MTSVNMRLRPRALHLPVATKGKNSPGVQVVISRIPDMLLVLLSVCESIERKYMETVQCVGNII